MYNNTYTYTVTKEETKSCLSYLRKIRYTFSIWSSFIFRSLFFSPTFLSLSLSLSFSYHLSPPAISSNICERVRDIGVPVVHVEVEQRVNNLRVPEQWCTRRAVSRTESPPGFTTLSSVCIQRSGQRYATATVSVVKENAL